MDKPSGPKPLEFTPDDSKIENRAEKVMTESVAVAPPAPKVNDKTATDAAAAKVGIAGAPAAQTQTESVDQTSVPAPSDPGAADEIQTAVNNASSVEAFSRAAQIYNKNN